jgi:hypothetical protein
VIGDRLIGDINLLCVRLHWRQNLSEEDFMNGASTVLICCSFDYAICKTERT